jgi:hypothetical protein
VSNHTHTHSSRPVEIAHTTAYPWIKKNRGGPTAGHNTVASRENIFAVMESNLESSFFYLYFVWGVLQHYLTADTAVMRGV